MKRLITTCLIVGLVVFSPAAASNLWPIHTGQKFVYIRSDPCDNEWIVRLEIGDQMTAKSLTYFHTQEWNYDNDSSLQDLGYIRTTEEEVYTYNPDGEDYLEFQKAFVGTKWSFYRPDDSGFNYQVNEIININEVDVPYGIFNEAYETRKYQCVDPYDLGQGKSPDWYDWIVPGVGMVKEEDYWVDPPSPWIMELVIPEPATICLLGLGCLLLGRNRKFDKKQK